MERKTRLELAHISNYMAILYKVCHRTRHANPHKNEITLRRQIGIPYNHLGYEVLTIAELDRERWIVELFFKWIKQHLHIKSFYGTSENAVFTLIWIAVYSFLILALAKKKLGPEQSIYTIAQTLGFVLFEKVTINQLFNKNQNSVSTDESLNLFSIS